MKNHAIQGICNYWNLKMDSCCHHVFKEFQEGEAVFHLFTYFGLVLLGKISVFLILLHVKQLVFNTCVETEK